MIQKEKIRGVGYFLMALAAGLLPFAAPDACAQALREGLALCGGPLLLSLFPFLIVSTLLIQCPAADVLGLPFCPVARLIGVRAPAAGRVLLIGSLGGFAPAANAAAEAVRSGQLTAREADALLPACVCSGPSFVILAVGQSCWAVQSWASCCSLHRWRRAICPPRFWRGWEGRLGQWRTPLSRPLRSLSG